jgi:hypothetical protein
MAALLGLGTQLWAQSPQDTPLGDVARNIRKAKVTTKPAEVSVDNDNFSKLMEEAESRRMSRMALQPTFGMTLGDGLAAGASLPAADINCRLSYTARGLKLTDIFSGGPSVAAAKDKPKDDTTKEDRTKDSKQSDGKSDVPAAELAKLEGPAAIVGDSLQLSIYNGSAWNIEEITVGLTLVRRRSASAKVFSGTGSGSAGIRSAGIGSADIVPVSAVQPGSVPTNSIQIAAKRSDTTLLYHFKGAAPPNGKATFQLPLGITLAPDQEWHWGILEARGTPPKN